MGCSSGLSCGLWPAYILKQAPDPSTTSVTLLLGGQSRDFMICPGFHPGVGRPLPGAFGRMWCLEGCYGGLFSPVDDRPNLIFRL
jgi:hypothetical protein